MKCFSAVVLVGLLNLLPQVSYAAGWKETLKEYNCLEVEKFGVNREGSATKEEKRSAAISEETLGRLQEKIVAEIAKENLFASVVKAGQGTCSGNKLSFGGKVTDYKKGNAAKRILIIGFGTGKQKYQVDSYVKNKKTGEMLAQKIITDRYYGAVAAQKRGEKDFAEKVAKFVAKGE